MSFIEMADRDLRRIVAHLPRDLRALLRRTPSLTLAGGCIRAMIAGEEVSDYDVFGPSGELLNMSAQVLAGDRQGRVHETDNALTVLAPPRTPVQFITRWQYQTRWALLEEFDFTIARAAISCGENGIWTGTVDLNFYPDLAAKRLVYMAPNRSEHAGGSLLRVRKFLARGYHIDAANLAGVVARLAIGVDQIRGAVPDESHLRRLLTALLREVDPLRVVDGFDPVEGDDAPEEQFR